MAKQMPGLSPRRRTTFLEALAASCNVTYAAKAASMSSSMAYRYRANDASFRLQWGEALATGYAQLEMQMLERALVGKPKIVTVDGDSKVIREYDDRIGIALLKMHRETVREVEAGVDGTEADEAAERILMRLQRLRAQLTGGVEVKRAVDRIAILAIALKVRRACA